MLMKLACYHRLSITRDNCSSFEELFVAGQRRLTREEDAIKRIFWETKKRNFFLRSRQTFFAIITPKCQMLFSKVLLGKLFSFFFLLHLQSMWLLWGRDLQRWMGSLIATCLTMSKANTKLNCQCNFLYKNFEYKKFEFQKFEFQKFENQGKLKIGATTNGSV